MTYIESLHYVFRNISLQYVKLKTVEDIISKPNELVTLTGIQILVLKSKHYLNKIIKDNGWSSITFQNARQYFLSQMETVGKVI